MDPEDRVYNKCLARGPAQHTRSRGGRRRPRFCFLGWSLGSTNQVPVGIRHLALCMRTKIPSITPCGPAMRSSSSPSGVTSPPGTSLDVTLVPPQLPVLRARGAHMRGCGDSPEPLVVIALSYSSHLELPRLPRYLHPTLMVYTSPNRAIRRPPPAVSHPSSASGDPFGDGSYTAFSRDNL